MRLSLKKALYIIVSSAVLLLSYPAAFANATNPTLLFDTMTDQTQGDASSHTLSFKMSASVSFAAGETISFDFSAGSFTMANVTTSDVTFNDGTSRTVVDAGASPSCSAGINNVIVTSDTTAKTLVITACSGYTASASNAVVTFKVGTAAGGTNRITNPGSNGSKTITLAGNYGDASTNFAVPILTNDQVSVSATVDPSITSALSSNTCTMAPNLTTAHTAVCTYTNTVNTNAVGGYASTIIDASTNSDGKLCSPSSGTCTNSIAVEGGNNLVTQGGSEYGVGTSKATQTLTQYTASGATTCTDADNVAVTAISGTTAKQYASATGPVSADVTTLCHAATVSGSQAAGAYVQTVTHITTATF